MKDLKPIDVAKKLKVICEKLNIGLIYKTSFDSKEEM